MKGAHACQRAMNGFPFVSLCWTEERLLCQTLWSWRFCDACSRLESCEDSQGCPARRLHRLSFFFRHYRQTIASLDADLISGGNAAIRSHSDVAEIAAKLKKHPDASLDELAKLTFPAFYNSSRAVELQDSLDFVARAMFMINCSAKAQAFDSFELGKLPAPWRSSSSFAQFVTDAFPKSDHPSLDESQAGAMSRLKASLSATSLKKRCGVRFRATDDLRRHLELDRVKGEVMIFHNSAFLKEQLRLSINDPLEQSVEEGLKR